MRPMFSDAEGKRAGGMVQGVGAYRRRHTDRERSHKVSHALQELDSDGG